MPLKSGLQWKGNYNEDLGDDTSGAFKMLAEEVAHQASLLYPISGGGGTRTIAPTFKCVCVWGGGGGCKV